MIQKKKKEYHILKRVYHKKGINDGLFFEVTNDVLNPISFHRTEILAKMKIKKLK